MRWNHLMRLCHVQQRQFLSIPTSSALMFCPYLSLSASVSVSLRITFRRESDWNGNPYLRNSNYYEPQLPSKLPWPYYLTLVSHSRLIYIYREGVDTVDFMLEHGNYPSACQITIYICITQLYNSESERLKLYQTHETLQIMKMDSMKNYRTAKTREPNQMESMFPDCDVHFRKLLLHTNILLSWKIETTGRFQLNSWVSNLEKWIDCKTSFWSVCWNTSL